ncbi:MAG: glycine zipper 2TM domain-containing protein [Longimicrobiales bacterium]
MAKYKVITGVLVLLPLLVGASACGDSDSDARAALEQEELSRELDLALRGDTFSTTFEDTAVATEPDEEAISPPVAAAPRPQPRTPVTTRPEPRRQAPVREPAPQPAPQPRVVTRSVPSGTSFAVRLNQELSTETSRAGQRFTATLSEPIMAADGSVLIPAGATVNGVVTGVQKSGRVGETAVLKLSFESISTGSRTYPIESTLVDANPQRRNRTSTREQATKIAAGAAAGAILGRVLGKDTEGTLKGAAIGAAAGTAVAMGTADVDAVLPTGSRLVIRLDAPVEVSRTVS